MSFGDDRDLEPSQERERDRRDAMESAEHIVDSLNRDGRRLDAACLGALLEHCRDLVEENQRLRLLKAPPKKQTVKSSGGRERASAKGTINNGGKAVHGAAPVKAFTQTLRGASASHKHDYEADGICRKFGPNGQQCLAKRQRQTEKSRAAAAAPKNGGADGALPGQEPLL